MVRKTKGAGMKIKIFLKILLLLLGLLILVTNCAQKKTEEQLFSEADSLLASGEAKSALRTYRDILRLFPQTPSAPRALFLMGIAYLENSQDLRAKEAFQKVLEEYPDYDLEKDFFDFAQESQNSDKPELAIVLYQKTMELFPESSNKYKALFLTGFVYSEQLQNYDKAKQAYQQVVEHYPDCDLADDAEFMLKNLGSGSLPGELK